MNFSSRLFALTLVFLAQVAATGNALTGDGTLDLELVGEEGQPGLRILVVGPTRNGQRIIQPVGRTMVGAIASVSTGLGPGELQWIRWEERGKSYYTVSEDGGRSWSNRRRVGTSLQLKVGEVEPGEPMPEADLRMPAAGKLFIAQAKIPWTAVMRDAVTTRGCGLRYYLPHAAYLLRCDSPSAGIAVGALPFIERVERYECSYRLAPEIGAWLEDDASAANEIRRVRVVTVRPGEKQALADVAEALGGSFGTTRGGGSLMDLWVNRSQLRQLACHDDLQYVDRWSPPESYMDNVRIDAGADWLELSENGGYCGTGVRGEVLDSGFDADHPEYVDRVVFHGSFDTQSHGTSCLGIVGAEGLDAQATGLLRCGIPIAADYQSSVTCGSCDRFDFTDESKNVFQASFQSNSWGTGMSTVYNTASWEMDEMIWRLDMAIFQAMNNEGASATPNNAAHLAWAKNIISVGGVHHQDNADPADDWWCDHPCASLHATEEDCEADTPYCSWDTVEGCQDSYGCGAIGPADDGRVKPDVSYFFDQIYTTTTNNAYTTGFNGTSAATPQAAATLGLMLEMWADTSQGGLNPWRRAPQGASVFEKQPHSATMKALQINSVSQYPFTGAAHDLSRTHVGWGRPNVQLAKERSDHSFVIDEEFPLEQGETLSWPLEVPAGTSELRVSLVYMDPPKAVSAGGKHLINDLDLKVVSPPDGSGDVTVYCGNAGLLEGTSSLALWTGAGGAALSPDCDDALLEADRDDINNVENVFIEESAPGASIAEGSWTVKIKAYEINTDGNPNENCRTVDLDTNPAVSEANCLAAGCQWDAVNETCGDSTWDSVFALVATGGAVTAPGGADGLTIAKNGGGTFQFSWNADCGNGANYGIYRGNISQGFGSARPMRGLCEVSGTSASVPEGSGSGYFYLVVPNGLELEGSYGNDSNGEQRAPSGRGCFPQAAVDECVS